MGRTIPQEVRANPGEQNDPPNREFKPHPKLPSSKAQPFWKQFGSGYQENVEPKQLSCRS
jgi:hypothetical protein